MSDWLSNVIGDDLITVYERPLFHRGRSHLAAGEASYVWRVARGGDRLVAVDGCYRPRRGHIGEAI